MTLGQLPPQLLMFPIVLLLLLALGACSRPEEPALPEEIPIIPVSFVAQTGGIYGPLRAPLPVHDPRYPLVSWTAESSWVISGGFR
ncbi:MAG: hypothetical protein ACRDIB_14765 [Ardenticatenaceae bacterium]